MDSRYAVWKDKSGTMYFGLTDSVYSHAVGERVKDNCGKILRHLDKIIGFKRVEMCYEYKSDVKQPAHVRSILKIPICTLKPLPEPVIEGLKKARNMIREEC